MINLRDFWQAAVANLRALFSARPARPPAVLQGRAPLRALPGPVSSGEWRAHPPRQIDVAPTPQVDAPEPPAQETIVPADAAQAEPAADTSGPAPIDSAAQTSQPPADGTPAEEEPSDVGAAPPSSPQTHETMPPVAAELEALLFVAAEPTAPADLARALALTPEEVDAALAQLAEFYRQQGRGLRLQRFNGKVQLVTAPVAAPSIERFLDLDNTSRLSGPALETLAVIAYRQPVTRAQIESVRGVDCAGVLRSLLQRGLVAEVGRMESPGRPILYGVTEHFMQHFGLTALDELPPLEEEDADRLWASTLLAEEEGADAEQVEARD